MTIIRSSLLAAHLAVACLAVSGLAHGQENNPCDQPGESPDLVVGDIAGKTRWGSVGDITAFSVGKAACNVGSCWVSWSANTAEHPVSAQNMFRLEGGRFEHIGQSWLFHEYFALSQLLCSTGCIETNGAHLGLHCATSQGASTHGDPARLGPKSEVNPASGQFPFPATGMGQHGDAIFKRLQVHDADLDPSLHPNASYFVEVQLVARDAAAAGNLQNNASYRPVSVIGSAGSFDIVLTGATVRAKPAIEAWKVSDPEVLLTEALVPGDGRFVVGARVTSTPSGYHYEYAVHNLGSDRSAGSFSVPMPPGAVVSAVGFHDVDYHSGEVFSGADWSATVTGSSIVWAAESYGENQNANALRWGTLYNFRFDSPLPPGNGRATLGLFRPGTPGEVLVDTLVPCGGGDADADAYPGACDCDDADLQAWATPGEARDLVLSKDPVKLGWNSPVDPGGAATLYDVVRAPDPSDFVTNASCLPFSDPWSLTCPDAEDPGAGGMFCYLVRARNSCPEGAGTPGTGSGGAPRVVRSCP